jgi:biotin transporter BioY
LFASGMYPFLPGDFVKLMIAALIVGAGWAIVDHRAKKREEER